MVTGTQCPALSDQLKKWSESRAAAKKGQCPIEHRGEFPDVILGLWELIQDFEVRAESRFEA